MLLTAGPGVAGLGYGSSLTEQLDLHREFLVIFLGNSGVLGSEVRERLTWKSFWVPVLVSDLRVLVRTQR